MITFTISSFLLIMFTIIIFGVMFGIWLIFTEEARDKKTMEKSLKKRNEK